jgi:hypothetical protein
MKNFFLFLFFNCFACVFAQEWKWAANLNFGGSVSGSTIGGVDKDGSVYLVNMVSGDDHLHPWNGYKMLKIGYEGNKLWMKNIDEYLQGRLTTEINGTSFLCYADKLICYDKNGNESWQIGNDAIRGFGKAYIGNDCIVVQGSDYISDTVKGFVARYSFEGIELNSTYYSIPKFSKCTVDNSQHFIVTSDDQPDPVTKNRQRLSLFDSQGNLIFKGETLHTPTSIICSVDNSIFINGWHDIFPVTVDGVQYKNPGNYILKYSSIGELMWYKIIEGTFGNSCMATDKENNLYYTLNFSTHIKIDGFEINHPTGGLLIIKYDKNGNKVWHQFTASYNTGPFGYIQPESVFIGENNDLYLSGRISGTLQFGNSILQTGSDMYSDLFVGRLSQNNPVGIKEVKINEQLWQVFPNPSGDIFTITGSTDEQIKISVTDTRGQQIKSFISKDDRKIDLSGLSNGVYLLHIRSGNRTETKKLVKN